MTEFDRFAEELLRVAPELESGLRERWEDARPDPETPILWMSAAGGALARAMDSLGEETLRAVFDLAERYLAGGSQSIRNGVATGFLEALASAVSAGFLEGPRLAAYLGPASRAYLDAWDQFTMGRSTLDPP
jgi:hypothetical protein